MTIACTRKWRSITGDTQKRTDFLDVKVLYPWLIRRLRDIKKGNCLLVEGILNRGKKHYGRGEKRPTETEWVMELICNDFVKFVSSAEGAPEEEGTMNEEPAPSPSDV